MKRWILLASVLILGASALFVGRQRHLRAEQAPETVQVTRGNVVQEALAVGSIVPDQEISVKSKVPGIVAHVHVGIGDFIRRGEPLLDIRPDPTPLERAEAERQVQIAEVEKDAAARQFARSRELSKQGLLSDQQLEAATEAHETARLRAQLASERLQLLRDGHARLEGSEVSNRILAPATGTVLTLDVHPGDPVVPLTSYQEGTVLLTMADMDRLIFRGTVDEVDVGKLHIGQPVDFTVGALPEAKVEGRLSRISPKARKQEAATLFDIEAAIQKTPGDTLRAGYSANARVAIARAESVLVLPERVVRFEDGKATVRILGDGGKPVEKEIQTGLSDGLTIEISGGLENKDAVLEPEKSALEKKK